MANNWNSQPGIIVVLQKLQELTLRVARLNAVKQAQRTQAVLAALKNNKG